MHRKTVQIAKDTFFWIFLYGSTSDENCDANGVFVDGFVCIIIIIIGNVYLYQQRRTQEESVDDLDSIDCPKIRFWIFLDMGRLKVMRLVMPMLCLLAASWVYCYERENSCLILFTILYFMVRLSLSLSPQKRRENVDFS